MTSHRYQDDNIFCVLGPTNTGKTYRAVEKMLGYHDGVIGFPLRLLARENYERVCAIKGKEFAALVTGEERIVPPNARYFCCTVESMPLQKSFEFVAIDEIQLCADPERGHVFTHRLLHARGSKETMVLGADTMRCSTRSRWRSLARLAAATASSSALVELPLPVSSPEPRLDVCSWRLVVVRAVLSPS